MHLPHTSLSLSLSLSPPSSRTTQVGQLRRDLAEHEYEIQCLKAELGEALSPLGGEGYAAAAAAESETRLAATLAAGAAERSAQDEFRARVTQMPETLVHLPRAVEGAQHAAEVASVRTAQHAADEGRRQLASDIYCHVCVSFFCLRWGFFFRFLFVL